MLARSLDGGQSWSIEQPPGLQPPPNTKVANVLTGPDGPPLRDCAGGYDFANPGFIITFRMESHQNGPSHYYVSSNRGKSWDGPCNLGDFGQPGIMARTDYLINGPQDMTVFLTAAKRNRHEGRVIVVRTRDGAKTWNFQSYMGPEPLDYSIMPSSVRVGPASIVSAVRRRNWIDVYRSNDDGESWSLLNQAATDIGGNRPTWSACLTAASDDLRLPQRALRHTGPLQRRRRPHLERSDHPAPRRRRPRPGLHAPSCGPTASSSRSTTTTPTPPAGFIAACIWDLNSVR
jgi:hypothetical protein